MPPQRHVVALGLAAAGEVEEAQPKAVLSAELEQKDALHATALLGVTVEDAGPVECPRRRTRHFRVLVHRKEERNGQRPASLVYELEVLPQRVSGGEGGQTGAEVLETVIGPLGSNQEAPGSRWANLTHFHHFMTILADKGR